ncbi:MAG: general secretion pathway protein GspB [Sterolibacterium sp.]|jgi:general secretion pathway protein B
MSFILDALRKSDQQRSRNATPTLTTAQAAAPEQRPAAFWWYGTIAAALVGAGILIGWMHQAPPEPPAVAVMPASGKPVEANTQQFVPAPLATIPAAVRQAEPQPPQGQAAVPIPAAPAHPVAVAPQPAAPVARDSAALATTPRELAAKPIEPSATLTGEAPRDAAVIPLSELPPAIQQEIPKLSILAHSYSSKPKARFVFINDRMVHEEDYPLPGLKLEQITPDGMVFSYKGYRFRRAANADPR